jgi:nucleoid-associated protein YgaU
MHETHWNGYEPEPSADPAENPAEASQGLVMNSATSEEGDAPPPEVEPTPAPPSKREKFTAKLAPLLSRAGQGVHRISERLPLKTEVRVGLAAIGSFAILVTVLILNRGHSGSKPGDDAPKKVKVAASTKRKTNSKKETASASTSSTPKKTPTRPKPEVEVAEAITPPEPMTPAANPEKPSTSPSIATADPAAGASDDDLIEMPPLPDPTSKVDRTEVALAIPPPSRGIGDPSETPETTDNGDPGIVPPTPTTLLDDPKPDEEELPTPLASTPEPNDLPMPTESMPVEPTPVEPTPAEPAVAEPSIPMPEKPPEESVAVAETPAPQALEPTPSVPTEPVNPPAEPTFAGSPEVAAGEDSGHFEPLPLSKTPLTVDNVPPRRPRQSASTAPAVAAVPAEPVDPKTDAIEPVTHVVQKGENFWTISRLYYGSGRFYKALWAANQDQVSAPDRLFVGTTIKVPPPERLDRSRIDPVGTVQAVRPVPKSRSAAAPRTQEAADVIMMLPRGRPVAESAPVAVPKPEKTYPSHVVKRYETLRSIARDLLDDPRRASEIRELNLDQLDGDVLEVGQRLRLPEDASARR